MDIKSHVEALNASRITAMKELNDHFDAVVKAHPGLPMNEEEKAVQSRINDEIDDLEAEIKRFVAQETREQESAKVREAHASLFAPATPQETKSEAQRFAAWARGEGGRGFDVSFQNAGKFVESVRAGASARDLKAAILTGTGSGSLLVPTDLESTIYSYMTASVAMMMMPTTKINTASGSKR